MGYGDDILVTGWARRFGGSVRLAWWSPVYLHSPCLRLDLKHGLPLKGWERRYGYVRHATRDRFVFRESFRARRGELFFSGMEVAEAARRAARVPRPFIVVEPNVKGTVSADNKDWGFANWQCLVDTLSVPLVQLGPKGVRELKHVYRVETPGFRDACAVLALAKGFIGTDGALHHAAAALGKAAVVIWGAFSDPAILGYPAHVNLYEPDPDGLGQRLPHPACRAAMDRITIDRVLAAAEQAFE